MGPRTAAAAGVIAALALAPAAYASPHSPIAGKHKLGKALSTSTNWSGYDVTGSGATHVIGTWIQPTPTCTRGETSWSSPWVGIDGDTSGTVEQIGTDSDCNRGTPYFYAWYEMYPKGVVQIPSITPVPGHSYTGEVTANSDGTYTMSLTDNTVGPSSKFTTTQAGAKTANASVEWIVEGPSNGTLTNFGSVPFTSGSATINGASETPLGSLANLNTITMVTKKGVTRAQPGPVGNNPFAVTWKHS